MVFVIPDVSSAQAFSVAPLRASSRRRPAARADARGQPVDDLEEVLEGRVRLRTLVAIELVPVTLARGPPARGDERHVLGRVLAAQVDEAGVRISLSSTPGGVKTNSPMEPLRTTISSRRIIPVTVIGSVKEAPRARVHADEPQAIRKAELLARALAAATRASWMSRPVTPQPVSCAVKTAGPPDPQATSRTCDDGPSPAR